MPKLIDKDAVRYWGGVLRTVLVTASQEVAMKLAIIGFVLALMLIIVTFVALRLGVVPDSLVASVVDFAQASWAAFCGVLLLMTVLFLAILYRTPAEMDREKGETIDELRVKLDPAHIELYIHVENEYELHRRVGITIYNPASHRISDVDVQLKWNGCYLITSPTEMQRRLVEVSPLNGILIL